MTELLVAAFVLAAGFGWLARHFVQRRRERLEDEALLKALRDPEAWNRVLSDEKSKERAERAALRERLGKR